MAYKNEEERQETPTVGRADIEPIADEIVASILRLGGSSRGPSCCSCSHCSNQGELTSS